MSCLVAKSCQTLLRPHGSWPGSSVCRISQVRILEWVAGFLCQGNLPLPGIKPASPALAFEFFTTEPP